MSNPRIIYGRPDFGNKNFGITEAKKFPPYVFSISGNAALVHKVQRVKMRWYKVGGKGEFLIRVEKPFMIAETVCGTSRFLLPERTRTCMIPNPDAILCGACHGEPRPFGKAGKCTQEGLSRSVAHVKLGCVVKGY